MRLTPACEMVPSLGRGRPLPLLTAEGRRVGVEWGGRRAGARGGRHCGLRPLHAVRLVDVRAELLSLDLVGRRFFQRQLRWWLRWWLRWLLLVLLLVLLLQL